MRKIGIFVAAILLVTSAAGRSKAADQRLLEYDWLISGEPSGRQSSYYAEDGRIIITFSFNARGRGPETRTILQLNAAGVPVALHIKGKNYEKADVDERFSIIYGKGVWASKIEHEQANFNGQAFYVAREAPPELLAVLARAVLAREDGALPLLPSGTAHIRPIVSQTLHGDKGETAVTLYAMTGAGAQSQYIWLDQDRDLFGIDYNGSAIIRKGWLEHLPLLQAAQTKAPGARD
jgi:hypothetical protein